MKGTKSRNGGASECSSYYNSLQNKNLLLFFLFFALINSPAAAQAGQAEALVR